LFIVDDVQQGFFRTGKMFSCEHLDGIIPDGIALGKSFGAGLFGSCFIAKEEIINSLSSPGHFQLLLEMHLRVLLELLHLEFIIVKNFKIY